MTRETRFRILRETVELASASLDTGELIRVGGAVAEADRLNMQLVEREEGVEYQIRIGNLPPDAPLGFESGRDPALGMDLGSKIVWPAAVYLDSARGPTVVELRSRRADEDDPWRVRARVELTVQPSKLGEARYQVMFNELRALSAGLVFDLVSKSSRAYRFIHSSKQIHTGSRQLELRAIEQTWRGLVPLLHQIAEQPTTRMVRRRELRRCWGRERLHQSAATYLASRGVAPRSRAVPRPFTAPVDYLAETSQTPEHAVIAGFLDLLLHRLEVCVQSARVQISTLAGGVADSTEDALTGWAAIEYPRFERLREVILEAESIRVQVQRVREWPLFRGVSPALEPLRTPVFDSVAEYSRIRGAILAFLNRAGVVLDEGEGDLIKSTWRMYEQWVLIQLLAALRESGLRSDPAEDLIQKVGRSRFTLDFERGSQFLYHARDGRVIRVRYEPWIAPRHVARMQGESVYRRGGGNEWSPDILIEVLSGPMLEGRTPDVEYAVVIDAKYSEHLREERWDQSSKYFDIHGALKRRPVVRQVWLAYPGAQQRILPRDPGIRWYSDGPDVGPDENLHGALELLPGGGDADYFEKELGQPLPIMRTFVGGLLVFLDFDEAEALFAPEKFY